MNKAYCEQLDDSLTIKDNSTLYTWLQDKAQKENLTYLLAHADDGVIWGEFRGDDYQLVASGDNGVFPQLAKLRLCTLQQCRIFGENSEVMIWKVGQTWKARLIKDEHLSKIKKDYICEKQILWGTKSEASKQSFTLVSDGSQGLKHAVPLINIPFRKDTNNLYRPIRLHVHHYINHDDSGDDSGVARIYLSRLVDLQGT